MDLMDQPVQNSVNNPNLSSSVPEESKLSPQVPTPQSISPPLSSTPPVSPSPTASQPEVSPQVPSSPSPQPPTQPPIPSAQPPTGQPPLAPPPKMPPTEEPKLGKEKKPKKFINFLVIALLFTLALGGGGGFFAYQKFIKKEEKPEAPEIFASFVDDKSQNGLQLSDAAGNTDPNAVLHQGVEAINKTYKHPPDAYQVGETIRYAIHVKNTGSLPVTTFWNYGYHQVIKLSDPNQQPDWRRDDLNEDFFFEDVKTCPPDQCQQVTFSTVNNPQTLTWQAGEVKKLEATWTPQICGFFQGDFGINDFALNHPTGVVSANFVRVIGCDQASPPPSASPSPSPSPSPPSSPPPGISCLQLTPQNPTPSPGQSLTFTCTASATNTTINHYNFRVNEGTPTKVNITANQASFTYTVPQTGGPFTVQCQVCTSSDNSNCTAWGVSQQ